ncbi:uncharacterized protein Z520_08371 [Fonsecaea multimorphosa CBS 102226]|uniref:Uncharacterized protein n=1 Tax=Fonsecaea multimorphosa CBS 102226 TaxID=1442371 RepID=A0A0D2IGD3_9EURO|nr:uncharacterized protein Z520_08371 [Fonsecaea multimorphosa CBS 102226]KIX96116.1 hypothetical protein Z520_08371 [Fonsecaea multimorphosa CBS 102226]OAL19152.1 hypothetical protein AYO22_10100 [Fonsecaea multimorphosa]
MFPDSDDASVPADFQEQPPARRGEEQAHREQQCQTKEDNTAPMAATALSLSPLLSLPYELRQRVFQYVFMVPSSEIFPPRQVCSPSRLLGMVGDQYKLSGPGSSTDAASNNVVQPLLLCRQLYRETRMMPLQVNRVNCPATMGSNTSATKRFLDALMPVQRRAIRKLEVHLLASVTEAWSLRSILRSLAGVTETGGDSGLGERGGGADVEISWDEKGEVGQKSGEYSENPSGDSSLTKLTVHITTRDLLLAQADSMVGLLHILTVAPFPQDRPSTVFVCAATWVTEGLAFLKSLRTLTIVIESSVSVATQVTATERSQFEQALKSSLLSVNVTVEWRVHREMLLGMDDSEWVNFLWMHDSTITADGQGEPGVGRKVGFPSWTNLVS